MLRLKSAHDCEIHLGFSPQRRSNDGAEKGMDVERGDRDGKKIAMVVLSMCMERRRETDTPAKLNAPQAPVSGRGVKVET